MAEACAPVPVSGAESLVKHIRAAKLFLDEKHKVLEVNFPAALCVCLRDHLLDLLIGEGARELFHHLRLVNESILVLVKLLKHLNPREKLVTWSLSTTLNPIKRS